MQVYKIGNGKKTFVMIPGINLCGVGGSVGAIEQSFSMFLEDYTIYLFDNDPVLKPHMSLEDMAEEISVELKNRNLKDVCIYGASQGGMIGLIIAAKHPELVSKLLACSTSPNPTERSNKVFYELKDYSINREIVKINQLFFRKVFPESFYKLNYDALKAQENVGTAENCDRFIVLLDSIIDFDINHLLPYIKCKTMVVGDRNDMIFPEESMKRISDTIGCELIMYEGYGHAVYDLAPDFKDRMKRFFDGV